MTQLVLVIGTKRLSAWSMRAWLTLRQSRLDFREVVVDFEQPDRRNRILAHSPSGRVPMLKVGELKIWESLAICEYVAEIAREVPLWPEDQVARAAARAVANEMHAGFLDLRKALPMNLAMAPTVVEVPAPAMENVARITQSWNDCRANYGAGGPFLFGRWSIADAMYAPVATRLRTYGVPLDPVSAAYVEATYALPAMQEYLADARAN
jgi:glutathione S-transferase